jgi:DNA-binding LacI/PurR family transcriptional regulator
LHVKDPVDNILGHMGGPVGIKEVAAAAGVSITTVSHALSGKGRLREETRQRVREIATAIGYQPSALARGLAGGRTGMLAMTVSGSDDFALQVGDLDYFLQVTNAATSAAMERGYAVTLLPAHWSTETLGRLPLDGGIVVDPVRGDAVVGALTTREVPVVTLGRQPGGPPDAPWVDNDHFAGTEAMLDHMVEEGATRVALLAAHMVSSYALDTLEAYERWCTDHGADPVIATVRGSISERGAYAEAMKLLESAHPPDAIFATLDRLAVGALLAAEGRGMRVPMDLRIAGCSESEESRRSKPALSALSLNPDRLGEEAIDLLADLIEGRPTERQRIVPSVLIRRRSTQDRARGRRTVIAGAGAPRVRASATGT